MMRCGGSVNALSVDHRRAPPPLSSPSGFLPDLLLVITFRSLSSGAGRGGGVTSLCGAVKLEERKMIFCVSVHRHITAGDTPGGGGGGGADKYLQTQLPCYNNNNNNENCWAVQTLLPPPPPQ